MTFQHYSVLLNETIEQLDIKENGIYVDGTLGGGGHASAVLQRLGETGRLIGIDQDAAAIEAAGDRLAPFGDKVTIVRSNYSAMPQVLADLGIHGVDGIVLDLGVSSYQLDTVERGFTYREDTVLDMRMDQRQTKTARDIVNDYTETELFHMIRDYGEDKFARNIAKHIVMAREKKPIETTGELNDIIRAAIPAKVRAKGGHPSKKTYQAIRIELNHELDVLKNTLDQMIDLLNDHGNSMENITKEQADIIGEVANICTGTAATALSMIINRSTNITTPLVEVLDKENTLESDNHILVKVPYTSGLDGTNLMVLDVQDALVIASLMMGGDGRNLSNLQLDDLTLSAIAEAMNQMCGSIATSMASLLSRPTDIGFPLINSKDRKTFEIPDELCNGTDIVKVTFRLTVEDLIDSELIQLYPISIVKQILKQEDI